MNNVTAKLLSSIMKKSEWLWSTYGQILVLLIICCRKLMDQKPVQQIQHKTKSNPIKTERQE